MYPRDALRFDVKESEPSFSDEPSSSGPPLARTSRREGAALPRAARRCRTPCRPRLWALSQWSQAGAPVPIPHPHLKQGVSTRRTWAWAGASRSEVQFIDRGGGAS